MKILKSTLSVKNFTLRVTFTLRVATMRITGSLQKKKTHGKFCPVSLLNQHSDPSPPPTFFLLFQKIVADENKYSGLDILENQFSGRAHAENK